MSESFICPKCRSSMQVEAVICIECGYDRRTNRQHPRETDADLPVASAGTTSGQTSAQRLQWWTWGPSTTWAVIAFLLITVALTSFLPESWRSIVVAATGILNASLLGIVLGIMLIFGTVALAISLFLVSGGTEDSPFTLQGNTTIWLECAGLFFTKEFVSVAVVSLAISLHLTEEQMVVVTFTTWFFLKPLVFVVGITFLFQETFFKAFLIMIVNSLVMYYLMLGIVMLVEFLFPH